MTTRGKTSPPRRPAPAPRGTTGDDTVICMRSADLNRFIDVFVQHIKAAIPGPKGKALLDRIERELRAEGL